ncbi:MULTISPECIES: LysR substrate-binding domain-containing protein [Cupriavidus]|uniref:LysR substrate-binding domain-containing protein n=1 Tax=Cupriavidus TaxID=106589 RepID=UPI00197A6F9B|nr:MULTISPECIES: LysR substrate-binding domain-containing protein [Cupriavidus]
MGAVPLLTRALTDLRHRQPHLSIGIVEGTSTSLLALIDEGRVDLAICRRGGSRRPEAYDCVPLESEPLAVVAARAHPLTCRKTLTLRDLAEASWVAYPVNTPMRFALERTLADAGIGVPRYRSRPRRRLQP